MANMAAINELPTNMARGVRSNDNDGRQRNVDNDNGQRNVFVLVIGEIAYSPRMRAHAVSLKNHFTSRTDKQTQVSILGFNSIKIQDPTLNGIHLLPIPITRQRISYGGALISKIVNLLGSIVNYILVVAWILIKVACTSRLDCLVVQNPPSIGLAVLLALVCSIKRTQFIIDCHNFGYTLSAYNSSLRPLVPVLKWAEFAGLRTAHKLLCVSQAMQKTLNQYGCHAVTVYDRPLQIWPLLDPPRWEQRRQKLASQLDMSQEALTVVTSTSYTPDEDLSMLLEAINGFIENENPESTRPDIRLIISGKGPMQEEVRKLIAEMKRTRPSFVAKVVVHQMFLEDYQDYLCLISLADIGVSLHVSSSKVDLPMKITDMISVRLPVIFSVRFQAITELMNDEATFQNASELTSLLTRVDEFKSKPAVRADAWTTLWDQEWTEKVLPLLVDQKNERGSPIKDD